MSLNNFSSGVYIEEINIAQRPDQAPSGIVAAVLASDKGPVGVPYPVTSIDEFLRRYFSNGRPNPQMSLASYSVLRALRTSSIAYVVRVASSSVRYGGVVVSKKAANQLSPPTVSAAGSTSPSAILANGTYSYRVSALDEHGESLASTAATATVTTSPTTATLTTSMTGANNDLRFTAVTTGTVGNSNTVEFVDPSSNNSPLSITLTPNTGYASLSISLATNGSGTIVTTANDILTALGAHPTFSTFMTVALAPSNNGSGVVTALASTNLAGGAATGANNGRVTVSWTAVPRASSYRVYGRTGGSELFIAATTNTSYIDTGIVSPSGALPGVNTTNDIGIAPFAAGLADPAAEYVFDPDDMFIVYGADPGAWNNNVRISFSEVNNQDGPGTFLLSVTPVGQSVPAETWSVSRTDKIDGFGRQLFAPDRVNPFSEWIKVHVNPTNTAALDKTVLVPVAMSGGANGSAVTVGDIANAWDQFADKEQVTVRILINGGYTDPMIQLKMDQIARNRKDCIALLDVPSDQQETINAVNYRRNTLNINSSYSALYTPDLWVLDQYNDKRMWEPPSGFAAQALARLRYEGPAGIDNGLVESNLARHKYNQGQRDLLAKAQVNYVRTLPGAGLRLWEQFTLDSVASPTQYINCRMTLILMQASISEYLLSQVHRPNDPITRAGIESRVRTFMDVLVGARAVQDYNVVSNFSNNRAQNIDEGTLYVDVYANLTILARRIMFRTIITPTGVDFNEVALP